MKKYKWLKVDTASIMFTCLSSKNWGRTFRMAAVLKDEEVRPDILKKAAADLVGRFPATHSYLKKGFFWNYQELTDYLPEIREEYTRQLLPICYRNDGRPDFRITYYKRRIACESSHHLGDGKGFAEYFTALLERYVELCENPESEYKPAPFDEEEISNAFAVHYKKDGEKAEEDKTAAYHLPGVIEPGFLQLIFMMTPSEELHKKAKEKDMTVTEFVAAGLILGTINNAKEPISKPVVIAIPVNLRRHFESKSIRNFTIQSKIEFRPEGKADYTFDEICDSIRGQLKQRLEKSELQKTLNRYGGLVNNPVLKVVPNFIKLPVLRLSQKKTHSTFTTILTNTGNSDISPTLENKIERFDGVNGDTSGYGLISTCSALGCNGIFSMCFSICSHDTSWAKECVRVLSKQGLEIRVESTHGNGV